MLLQSMKAWNVRTGPFSKEWKDFVVWIRGGIGRNFVFWYQSERAFYFYNDLEFLFVLQRVQRH